MKRFAFYRWALAALLAISTQAFAQQQDSTSNHQNQAPDWQLSQQNGEPINWKMYQGKPVILHFWATWCPYCKRLQPKLVELANQYQQQDVTIVGISFNEDEGATPQDVLTSRGYTFKTAVDGDKVAQKYGVVGTPTTFFINRNGEAIFKYTNSDVNDPRLAQAVKAIAEL